eukprot:TRINITY_DN2450_c0_g1_i1.p1 TRINITY_DN2450_c0_g1~~TRINITY_DN2450_c0_g1_i1.p1  ORF type:complete len:807 (-),score=106.69 TRINITY_DN2450_c0_g1_i1:3-2423(-)
MTMKPPSHIIPLLTIILSTLIPLSHQSIYLGRYHSDTTSPPFYQSSATLIDNRGTSEIYVSSPEGIMNQNRTMKQIWYTSYENNVQNVMFCDYLMFVQMLNGIYIYREDYTLLLDFKGDVLTAAVSQDCRWMVVVPVPGKGLSRVYQWRNESYVEYQVLAYHGDHVVVGDGRLFFVSHIRTTTNEIVYDSYYFDRDQWIHQGRETGEFVSGFIQSVFLLDSKVVSVLGEVTRTYYVSVYDMISQQVNTTKFLKGFAGKVIYRKILCSLFGSVSGKDSGYCVYIYDKPNMGFLFVEQDSSIVPYSSPYLEDLVDVGMDYFLFKEHISGATLSGYYYNSKYREPKPCPSGTYKSVGDGLPCQFCPPETYQDEEGSTNCKKCSPGEYCTVGSSIPVEIGQESSTYYPFPIIDNDQLYPGLLTALLIPSSEQFEHLYYVPVASFFTYSVILLSIGIAFVLIPILTCCKSPLLSKFYKIDLFDSPIYDQSRNRFLPYKSKLGVFLTILCIGMMIINTICVIEFYFDYQVTRLNQSHHSNELNVMRTKIIGNPLKFNDPEEIFQELNTNVQYVLKIELLGSNGNLDAVSFFECELSGCKSNIKNGCDFSITDPFIYNHTDFSTSSTQILSPPYDELSSPLINITLEKYGENKPIQFSAMKITLEANPKGSNSSVSYEPYSTSFYVSLDNNDNYLSNVYEFDIRVTKIIRESKRSISLFEDESEYQAYVHLQGKNHLVSGDSQYNRYLTIYVRLNEEEAWIKEKEQRRRSLVETLNVIFLLATVMYNVSAGIIGIHKKMILCCRKPNQLSLLQ